jgi:hypothetical protein
MNRGREWSRRMEERKEEEGRGGEREREGLPVANFPLP